MQLALAAARSGAGRGRFRWRKMRRRRVRMLLGACARLDRPHRCQRGRPCCTAKLPGSKVALRRHAPSPIVAGEHAEAHEISEHPLDVSPLRAPARQLVGILPSRGLVLFGGNSSSNEVADPVEGLLLRRHTQNGALGVITALPLLHLAWCCCVSPSVHPCLQCLLTTWRGVDVRRRTQMGTEGGRKPCGHEGCGRARDLRRPAFDSAWRVVTVTAVDWLPPSLAPGSVSGRRDPITT